MASYTGGSQQYTPSAPPPPYSPSAPPPPGPDPPRVAYPYQPPQPPANPSSPYAPITHTHSSSGGGGPFGSGYTPPPPQGYGSYPYHQQPPPQNVHISFPPGTHPDVIRSFQMVDRNQNGSIEEKELQEALAWNYQKFSRRTLRLLIFLFRDSRESSFRIGEFLYCRF